MIKRTVFIILSIAVLILTENVSSAGRAISLSVLQERVKETESAEGSINGEIYNMCGITRLDGYVIDKVNKDVILFGEIESGYPTLKLADLIVALRNIWMVYAQGPGGGNSYHQPYLSIEPELENMKILSEIGNRLDTSKTVEDLNKAKSDWKQRCGNPQKVVIKGIPRNSGFSRVLFQADYAMKRIAVGEEAPGISDFKSYSRLVLEDRVNSIKNKSTPQGEISIGSRFWFYPGEVKFLTDSDIISIDVCEVRLLTEKGYLKEEGLITQADETDTASTKFANDFTDRFQDLGKEKKEFIELENLFNIFALCKAMNFKKVFTDSGLNPEYILYRLRMPSSGVPESVQGISAIEEELVNVKEENLVKSYKVAIPFCGGVNMNIQVSDENFIPDTTGELLRIKEAILKARPSPRALYWDW